MEGYKIEVRYKIFETIGVYGNHENNAHWIHKHHEHGKLSITLGKKLKALNEDSRKIAYLLLLAYSKVCTSEFQIGFRVMSNVMQVPNPTGHTSNLC